jgi:hypothetical protein
MFYVNARCRTFAILYGMALQQHLPIVSPSEYFVQSDAEELRYVPRIEPERPELLSAISKSDSFRDDGTESASHGSIESRMRIVGGNSHFLFSGRSREGLDKFFVTPPVRSIGLKLSFLTLGGLGEERRMPIILRFQPFQWSHSRTPVYRVTFQIS